MQIDRTMRDGCIVVAIIGSINLFTAPRVQRVLLKDLAERPYAIVCDLSGVDALDPVCATVFSTVANHPASDWPATAFLLCGTRPGVAEVLKRLAMPVFLPLYDTVEEALDQVAARLNVIDRAELLADELVINAVVHARTSLRVRLELRGDLLHIGVHDASPRLLRVVPDDPDSETGRGLRPVEQLAAAWGVHRGRDGGKVVCCTLRLWRQPGPNGRSRP